MKTEKIESLKKAVAVARADYEMERDRLIDAGLKSNERCQLLKWVKAHVEKIRGELDKMTQVAKK